MELWTSERDHVERPVARPLEQVLDEVEQAGIGPLHVLEGKNGRIRVRETFEEQAPGGEQILSITRRRVLEPQQVREAGLDEGPLLRIEQMLRQRGGQLLPRRSRTLVLGDSAAHPHHVRQRPVGHAFPVRKTAPAMPVHDVDDAVEVLVELPRQPGLADSRHAGHGDEVRPPVLRGRVEEILDQVQLAVTTDERRFEPFRLQLAAPPRDDPERPPDQRRAFLPLQLVLACSLVRDRLIGRPPRRLAYEH